MDVSRSPIFHYAFLPLTPCVHGGAGFSVTAYAGGALAVCTYATGQQQACTWFRLETSFRVQLSRLLDDADAWLGRTEPYFPLAVSSCRAQLVFWGCVPLFIDEPALQLNGAQADAGDGAGIRPVSALFWDTAALLAQQGFYLSADGFQWSERCRIILPHGAADASSFPARQIV